MTNARAKGKIVELCYTAYGNGRKGEKGALRVLLADALAAQGWTVLRQVGNGGTMFRLAAKSLRKSCA